ncbi:MAG: flagellar hook-associated protein FlgL [Lachnospiraceae bacterium]|nr:flagellar hook-associated protein FlgL [Lachnospiraceae bacterium]
MRITNRMMINNSLRDINNNKTHLDKLNTQFSTEKKIQKPSDDPIVAIRALRFRSDLAELDQYLERNIPDADAWLGITEEALTTAREMIQSIQPYLVQGSTETLGTQERAAIIENLEAYKDQILQDANTDYANRTIFTGYKTDQNMTFETDENDTKYVITEKLLAGDADRKSVIVNAITDEEVKDATTSKNADDMPEMVTVHRVRLAYDKLDAAELNKGCKLTGEDGSIELKTIYAKSVVGNETIYEDSDGNTIADPYNPPAGGAYLLADAGEIILSEDAYNRYQQYTANGKELSITYQKTGFKKGELCPEHYFSCTKNTPTATETFDYTGEDQVINYTINFNQKIKVNTEGKDVYSHDIVRDVEELLECTKNMEDVERRISELEYRIKNASDTEKANLNTKLEALEKERTLSEEILQKRFEEAITEFQGHQQKFDLAITDVGNRKVRLALNKERLTSQQTNLEELKSINEDADMAETAILLKTASYVYEASLSSTSKVMSTSLMDFI